MRRLDRSVSEVEKTVQTFSQAHVSKRESILREGPKTFYYLDERQVTDLYPQVVQELEPTRIETKQSKQLKGGVSVEIVGVKPGYEAGKAEETTKIYEVKQTTQIMYNKIEKYFMERGAIHFGLEDFEFEKSSIGELKSIFQTLRNSRTSFAEELNKLENELLSDKMKELASEQVKKLSSVAGYVATQAELSVGSVDPSNCTLTFVHPISQYVQQTRIEFKCLKSYMTPLGDSYFEKDKSVKCVCLGKVVRWNAEGRILEISPIAIY